MLTLCWSTALAGVFEHLNQCHGTGWFIVIVMITGHDLTNLQTDVKGVSSKAPPFDNMKVEVREILRTL